MLSIEPLVFGDVGEISKALPEMDPWLTLGYKQEAVSHYLLRSDPSLSRYSLRVSGRLSGVLAIRFPWLFGPFMELIALFDECRGRGFGRASVDWICAKFQHSPNLWATVSSFNTEAQKFYARMGFEHSATLPDLIEQGWDEILLRKRLYATLR